ncbi:MAG: hypothetical protein WA110_10690 [Anaerolineaceae bacterium]
MTTNDERIKILTMLQEGKIDSTEAARLLQALDNNAEPAASSTPPTGTSKEESTKTQKPRFLHVKVSRLMDGKSIVDIRVPVSVVNAGIRMGAKFSPEMYGLDKDTLAALMDSPEKSQIVDVTDEEDGEHVQIFLE